MEGREFEIRGTCCASDAMIPPEHPEENHTIKEPGIGNKSLWFHNNTRSRYGFISLYLRRLFGRSTYISGEKLMGGNSFMGPPEAVCVEGLETKV